MQFFKPLRHTLLSITLAVILSVLGGWFILGGGTTQIQTVSAGSTDNLSGYAWSSNIGWISFNCTNPGEDCGTSNYGVRIDESQRFLPGGIGGLSGWAWSSNIGWISFNRSETGNPPSSDIGSGSGPVAQISWTNSTNGNITGWARALAGCQNVPGVPVGSCSGSGAGAASGGWDGWIKLSSTAGEPSYGVQLSGSNFSGYAWGGGVVGWIKFASTVGEPSYGVIFNPIGTPPPLGCGTANGVPKAPPAPSTNLCSDGSTPAVTNNPAVPPGTPAYWSWTCSNGGTPVSCTAPFPQCSDGIDNDGDGTIDFGGANPDTGCSSATDNTERDFKFKEF